MSISCSIKFSPHSVTAEQVHAVVRVCQIQMFKGLGGGAQRNENGRVDWLLTYYSTEPRKAGIVYAVIAFRLNSQGHTLGFNVGAKASAFSRWIVCYLMNEIALRHNGLLRAEGHQPQSPGPVSPSLSTFLTDAYGKLPHHMLTQQAGAFPPEFSLEDNWIHGHTIKASNLPAPDLGGLEAGPHHRVSDVAQPLLPG